MLILKSKKAKREIINLGYGKPYKVIEIIKTIRDIIKKGKLDIGKIPIRKDESMISYPNIKKVYKLVGWKPKIKLFKGLKYTINHYKNVLK